MCHDAILVVRLGVLPRNAWKGISGIRVAVSKWMDLSMLLCMLIRTGPDAYCLVKEHASVKSQRSAEGFRAPHELDKHELDRNIHAGPLHGFGLNKAVLNSL